MTPRRPFVRSLRSSARLAVAAAAFAVAACGLDPAATDAPAASAEGRRAAAATPEPAAAPAPPRVVVPKRIRTLSAHVARTVLIGAAAQDARDVIPAPEPAADDDRDDAEPRTAATAGAADDAAAQTAARLEAASLVVGRDDALRGLQPDALRVAVARGAVVFVDAWTGDEAWLLSLAPGGRVRPVTAADEVLAKPHVLTALPPSHSDPDPRILGVEERGELRVIATRQDTLCHDCACGKAAGRRAFARNLSAHAARVFDASRARGAGPEVAIRAASLRGSALHVEATIRNDGPDAVMGRVEVLPREGVHPAYPAAPIAATSATVEPGTTRTVVLDATVARPFDVIEHRVVASRADDVEVVRVVAPLVGLVGAEELRLVTVGSVAAGSRATARVLVRNSLTREGVPDADVTLRLAADDGGDVGAPARSRTDRFGACDVVIDAPETLPAKLRFSATSEVRGVRDEVQAEASAVEDFGAHLFLDLPVHRPGDRVRGRALVVRRPTGRPAAGEQVEFQLLDPEGREVVSASRTANAFGIADAGLDVPGSAVPGDYTIRLRRASLVVADAQVRIERFEVPRYRLAVAPSARVVRPGATLTVAVEASRFDGAAVGGAEVSASLRTGAWGDSPLARWEGTTDAAGRCDVRLDVPRTAAFAGAPDVVVDVAVRDAGGRAARELVRLASSPENSPAAGDGDADRAAVGATLHLPDGPPAPGAAGRILVRTDLPEGAEIPVAVDGGAPRTATVDTLGFLDVAIDGAASGTVIQVGGTRLTSPAERADLTLTLADRLVAPGTKLRVRIGAPTASQVVFLELLQSGIHAATYTVPVVGGRAEADLDLPAGIDGLVSLQASLDPCDTGGAVVARTAFIVPQERVRVALATESASYAPGEALRLDVNVTDTTGRGIPAVLGLRIADEAVLSLVRRPPGSARAALALGSSGRGRADEASGLSAASLVQKATRSALTPAERRLLDVLLAETDRVRMPSSDVSSLPPRIAANVRLTSAQFERFVEGLPERALAVLDDGSVPPPRQDVPDVVAALQQAALVGAFGPDGLADPWGTPLVVRTRGSFPLDYVSDNALPEPPLSVEMRSPGPDAAWGTPDDVAGSIDWSALLPLHRRWVTAHGHVFDDAAFELNGRAIGIGGAAGGAFGGRRGGHRNLRAGGGGKKSAVWLAPASTRERQFFPEALHFGPFVETDAEGRAHLDLTAPDSLTTWRAEAVASDAAGRAADGETSFRTTLAFAGEIDAPGTMLVGDEIEVPVVVRWGEGERAALSVEATVSPEAVLLSPPSVQIAPAASGEFALPVRVRAVRAGALRLAVRLNSHTRTDASARTIDVLPAGRPAQVSVSRSVGAATTLRIDRARSVVAGSERVELKLRPSAAADVLDGVDGILRKPHGCFEQASSAVFPNALALRWLQATGGSSPVLRQRFLDAIDEGTDLLLSYEIEGGGFDWFGRAPAKLLLSAYGLHEWRAIHEVRWAAGRESSRTGGAAEIADRTATWLVSQQAADGSFADKDAPYEWRGRVAGRVAATAYVGWALVGDRPGQGAGGDASAAAASSAREFVAAHAAEIDDPYTLAVATVFLLARDPADPVGATLAARLANVRADAAPADRAPVTAFHSRRGTADVEVDALAAIAALRLGNSAALPLLPRLAAIADRRGPDGTWGTTHATVLALWASLAAQTAALPAGSEIVVRPSGGAERRVLVAAEDLGRTVTLDLPGAAAGGAPIEVHIAYAGSGEFGATLVLSHAVPFDAAVAASAGPLSLTVTPSATTLSAGAPLDLDLRVTNSGAAPVAMPTIEVPLASGVLADLPALAALRRRPDVGRVEADASRIVVYLRELAAGATFQCTLRTSPRLRGRVTLPPASAYAYYEPDRIALAKPAVLTVE